MPGNEIKEIEGQTPAGLRSRQEKLKHFRLQHLKMNSRLPQDFFPLISYKLYVVGPMLDTGKQYGW